MKNELDELHFAESEPIMAEICDPENIMLAWLKVREKNGCAGIDGTTVDQFTRNAQGNLMRLQEDLLTGAYHPAPLLRFYVNKSNGEKRALSVPTVYDRVAQQAASAVLTPLLDATFEPCSFGYRKGKGRKQAIEEIARLRNQGHCNVVSADIENYFDSVDHWLLIQRLADLVPEESIVRLIAGWLRAEIHDGNSVEKLTLGLPQGSVLSPLLSNLYLDLFDKVMMERGYSLIRYVDDFVILEKQKIVAQQALQLTEHLLGQLHLRLKAEKTEIVTFEQGFRYLGVQFLGRDVYTTSHDNLKLIPETAMVSKSEHGTKSSHPGEDILARFGLLSDPEKIDSQEGDEFETPPLSHTPHSGSNGESRSDHESEPAEQYFVDAAKKVAGEEPPCENWITQQFRTIHNAIQQLRSEMMPQGQAEPTTEEPIARENLNKTFSTSRLLSTLYLHEQGSVLSYSQRRLIVTKGEDVLLELPAIKIGQIMIFGQCSVTTPAIDFCLKAGIPICFLSIHGSYYGRLTPPIAKQASLHHKQFMCSADQNFALKMAKSFVCGKIHNQRVLLQRRQWKLNNPEMEAAIQFLAEMLQRSEKASSLDELRGYEGTSSAQYFRVFGLLLDSDFSFSKRTKFPPTDPVNALLSFGYTLLFQNIYSLVEAHNLHPYCGHLHALRDGHPALVSDLIEEFRAPIVDSLVTYLINTHIIKPADFEKKEDASGQCFLNPEARKTYVQHFENKMQATITHPHTGYNVDYRRCLDLQITELAQCIRDEREIYRPMKIKP